MPPTPLMPEGQGLAFAAKPVVQAPVLVSILFNQQIHAAAVGRLVVAGAGFCCLDACIGEGQFDGTFLKLNRDSDKSTVIFFWMSINLCGQHKTRKFL